MKLNRLCMLPFALIAAVLLVDPKTVDSVAAMDFVHWTDGLENAPVRVIDGSVVPNANETIWLHIEYIGEGTETRDIGGICVVPTGHILLRDSSMSTLETEAYGCITLDVISNRPPCRITYSAWGIDRISTTQPPADELDDLICCPSGSCNLVWNRVDLPPDFDPIEYVEGCARWVPLPGEPSPNWEPAYENLFDDAEALELFRDFRDIRLHNDDKGRFYTRWLYQLSSDALSVLLENPELMATAKSLIEVNTQSVESVVNNASATLMRTPEVLAFLEAYAREAPPRLELLAILLKVDMERKRARSEDFFGFHLE
ncbi:MULTISPECIES: hypothetical protein [unclassified Thiocapsa]|uniref:hypothetical protein n=1 Tax=unclassified Thiocapsa TaxID=2641286 RepID=UPI0035AED025